MNYILKTMDNNRFVITEEEFKQLASVKSGMIFIKSCNSLVNINSVSSILPKNNPDATEDKKNQTTGILHDGQKVRRHFGEWVADDGLAVDDKGNYVPARLNRQYYPEVALDCVSSELEYEKIKHLPLAERKKLICGERVERIESQEPKQLKDLL